MSISLYESDEEKQLELEQFSRYIFGFQPKTEEEWKLYSVIESIVRKHEKIWDVSNDYLYAVVVNIINEFSKDYEFDCNKSRDGLALNFKWRDYVNDYKNNVKHLIPVNDEYQGNFKKEPLFYYYLSPENTNIKIDLNQLDSYKNLKLADVLILSMPTEDNLKVVDSNGKSTNDKSLAKSDLMFECAVYSLRSNALVKNNYFEKVNLLRGNLLEYFFSILDEYLEKDKNNIEVKSENVFNTKLEEHIVQEIKSDLYFKVDLQPERIKKLKQSLKELFNDESGYGYDNIYKYSQAVTNNAFSNNFTKELIRALTTDIHVRFINKSPDKYKLEPNLSIEKSFINIKDFLMETRISDLLEYGIDLNHKNLKDGIPLLPLIAEFSKDIGIKFKKDVDIPKLSDLTRDSVEIKL